MISSRRKDSDEKTVHEMTFPLVCTSLPLLENSPVALCQSDTMRVMLGYGFGINEFLMKNALKLSFARFNVYNIYTMYERVPIDWTVVRRA